MFRIDGHLGNQRDTISETHPGKTRVLRDSNGLPREEIWLYNNYASAIPAYQPCLVRYDGDEEKNPFVVSGAAASGTLVVERVVVPQVAVPAASWGWFVIGGNCTCLVEGTSDVAKDDYLRAAAATHGGLTKDGTALSHTACGIAREAQAANSAVAILVYLLGERVSIEQAAA
jgi:hypothetical protein